MWVYLFLEGNEQLQFFDFMTPGLRILETKGAGKTWPK